jgi:acetyl esterase/lipase
MQRAWLILLSVSYAVCMVGAKWPLLPSDPELQNVLKQLAQGPIARPVLSATPVNEEHYTRRHYLFNCTDVHCSGWLYLPTLQVNGSSKPPVVVMGHGLGGTKRWLDDYASYFAKNGFAVFSFDYRYWGGSEGQPRQWISVKRQLADWQSAVAFVQRAFNTSIDAQRLSLWGSSFAGGHVITTAATLGDAVKAVVSQVSSLTSGTLRQANAAPQSDDEGMHKEEICTCLHGMLCSVNPKDAFPHTRKFNRGRAGATTCVCSVQVPHLDGPLASMISLMHRGLISNAVLALAAIADSAYGAGDGQPFYVPLVRLKLSCSLAASGMPDLTSSTAQT